MSWYLKSKLPVAFWQVEEGEARDVPGARRPTESSRDPCEGSASLAQSLREALPAPAMALLPP